MIDPTIHAVQTIEADLLWLTLPERPTCGTCEGDGRIGDERKVCPRCDGIGSTEPAKGTPSPYQRARQVLTDRELQAAIVRAQHPEGSTHPTEGSTGWSDPTGDAVCRELATDLRGEKILRTWQAELREAADCVSVAAAKVRRTLGLPMLAITGEPRHVVAVCSWMLRIPHSPLEAALSAFGAEDGSEVRHALARAAERTTAVRSGRPDILGTEVPSVSAVLVQARRAMEVRPPKPVQKPLEGCVSCARDHAHFEPYDERYSGRKLCRPCGDYTSGNGAWPPVGAVEWMHRHGKRFTEKVIMDAKRAEQVRRRVG